MIQAVPEAIKADRSPRTNPVDVGRLATYIYDPRLRGGRYVNVKTGRVVKFSEVHGALAQATDDLEETMARLATLVAREEISERAFYEAMVRTVRHSYNVSTALACGGWHNVSQSQWGTNGGLLRMEYGRLVSFASDITDGRYTNKDGVRSEAAIVARARLYANTAYGRYWAIEDGIQLASDNRYERLRTVGDDRTCDECRHLESYGWVPIGTHTLPIHCGCRCRKEYSPVFEAVAKHYGPGPHEDGSPQSVHAGADSLPWLGPDEVGRRWIGTAKKMFGTTREFAKAGFILPDGTMLDFKRDAGWDKIDHASIGRAMPDYRSGKAESQSSPTARFLRHTGAIRVFPARDSAGKMSVYAQTMRPLTVAQKDVLLAAGNSAFAWSVMDLDDRDIQGASGRQWDEDELEHFAKAARRAMEESVKHLGPGPHPDGSPQSVHGRKGPDQAWSGDLRDVRPGPTEEAAKEWYAEWQTSVKVRLAKFVASGSPDDIFLDDWVDRDYVEELVAGIEEAAALMPGPLPSAIYFRNYQASRASNPAGTYYQSFTNKEALREDKALLRSIVFWRCHDLAGTRAAIRQSYRNHFLSYSDIRHLAIHEWAHLATDNEALNDALVGYETVIRLSDGGTEKNVSGYATWSNREFGAELVAWDRKRVPDLELTKSMRSRLLADIKTYWEHNVPVKHYGPGPHPDGSPQSVHGRKGDGTLGKQSAEAMRQRLAQYVEDGSIDSVTVDPLVDAEFANELAAGIEAAARRLPWKKPRGLMFLAGEDKIDQSYASHFSLRDGISWSESEYEKPPGYLVFYRCSDPEYLKRAFARMYEQNYASWKSIDRFVLHEWTHIQTDNNALLETIKAIRTEVEGYDNGIFHNLGDYATQNINEFASELMASERTGTESYQRIRIAREKLWDLLNTTLPRPAVKHLGPGPHPSGSPQAVHGREGDEVDDDHLPTPDADLQPYRMTLDEIAEWKGKISLWTGDSYVSIPQGCDRRYIEMFGLAIRKAVDVMPWKQPGIIMFEPLEKAGTGAVAEYMEREHSRGVVFFYGAGDFPHFQLAAEASVRQGIWRSSSIDDLVEHEWFHAQETTLTDHIAFHMNGRIEDLGIRKWFNENLGEYSSANSFEFLAELASYSGDVPQLQAGRALALKWAGRRGLWDEDVRDAASDEVDAWLRTINVKGVAVKHLGPGPHPSGSPQTVHGQEREGSAPWSGPDEIGQAWLDNAKLLWEETGDFRKAGYILPDGTMLDFNRDDPWNETEHSDIGQAAPYGYDADEAYQDMSWVYKFMRATGAIRNSPDPNTEDENPTVFLEAVRPLTRAQIDLLASVGNGTFAWSVIGLDGYEIDGNAGPSWTGAEAARFDAALRASELASTKHLGPGPHPSGSPQAIHGKPGGEAAWQAEHGVNPMSGGVGPAADPDVSAPASAAPSIEVHTSGADGYNTRDPWTAYDKWLLIPGGGFVGTIEDPGKGRMQISLFGAGGERFMSFWSSNFKTTEELAAYIEPRLKNLKYSTTAELLQAPERTTANVWEQGAAWDTSYYLARYGVGDLVACVHSSSSDVLEAKTSVDFFDRSTGALVATRVATYGHGVTSSSNAVLDAARAALDLPTQNAFELRRLRKEGKGTSEFMAQANGWDMTRMAQSFDNGMGFGTWNEMRAYAKFGTKGDMVVATEQIGIAMNGGTHYSIFKGGELIYTGEDFTQRAGVGNSYQQMADGFARQYDETNVATVTTAPVWLGDYHPPADTAMYEVRPGVWTTARDAWVGTQQRDVAIVLTEEKGTPYYDQMRSVTMFDRETGVRLATEKIAMLRRGEHDPYEWGTTLQSIHGDYGALYKMRDPIRSTNNAPVDVAMGGWPEGMEPGIVEAVYGWNDGGVFVFGDATDEKPMWVHNVEEFEIQLAKRNIPSQAKLTPVPLGLATSYAPSGQGSDQLDIETSEGFRATGSAYTDNLYTQPVGKYFSGVRLARKLKAGESSADYMEHADERSELKDKVSKLVAAATGVDEETASTFVADWAGTSNRGLAASIIQEEASKMFGVPLSDYQRENLAIYTMRRENHFKVNKTLNLGEMSLPFELVVGSTRTPMSEEVSRDLTRKALKAMYDQTQAELKQAGVDNITLFRGVKNIKLDVGTGQQRTANLRSNALESWSLSPTIAASFGDTVLAASFPRERILSTPRSGFGCWPEWECVVIGDSEKDEVTVYNFAHK